MSVRSSMALNLGSCSSAAPTVAAQVSMISGQEMSQESIVGQLSLPPTQTSRPFRGAGSQPTEPVWRRVRPERLPSRADPFIRVTSWSRTSTIACQRAGDWHDHRANHPRKAHPQQSVFFTSTEPGLSTALGVLKGRFRDRWQRADARRHSMSRSAGLAPSHRPLRQPGAQADQISKLLEGPGT